MRKLWKSGALTLFAAWTWGSVSTAQQPPQAPAAKQPAETQSETVSAPLSGAGASAPQPDPTPQLAAAATQPPKSDIAEKLAQIMGKSGGLTAEEAGRRARATSLDAAAKDEQIQVADARISQVFFRAAPRLTLTARYTRLSAIEPTTLGGGSGNLVGTTAAEGPIPAGTPLFAVGGSAMQFSVPENNYFLNAGLVVPLSDYLLSTGGSIEAAEASKRAAALSAKAARVRAAANAKLAYYGWAQRELETVVAIQSSEQAQAQLKRIENNFRAGRIAEADVLSARAFVASAELLVQRSRTNAKLSEQQLRIMMHAGEERFELGEDLLAAIPNTTETKSLEQLYREAAQQRLEIRALDETAYSLKRGSDVQQSDSWPRLEAFGNLTLANPNQRIFPQEQEWNGTWDVGAQVIWTLNDVGTAQAAVKQTLAERREIIAQRSALQDGLKTEVLSAHRGLSDARLALETAERGVEAAHAAHAARSLLLEHGRVTSLEVMDAETALLRARLDLINAHVQLRVARVQLDYALGRDAK